MGCLFRLGCLTLLLIGLFLALGVVLATRPVGPSYSAGVYRYEVAGQMRQVRISEEAARRFDAKLRGDLSPVEVAQGFIRGVPVTEEELNSRLAEQVAAEQPRLGPWPVERLFIRLAEDGARAYVYTGGRVRLVVQAEVQFSVREGQLLARVHNPHAGLLPVDPLAWALFVLGGERRELEHTVSVVVPRSVAAVRVEEGRLRVELTPGS